MHEEVKTVALTAAGHLVLPAAGSTMDKVVRSTRSNTMSIAVPGSAITGCQLACTMGSIGGKSDTAVPSSKLQKVRMPTDTSADFRAQMKEAAWRRPPKVQSQDLEHISTKA